MPVTRHLGNKFNTVNWVIKKNVYIVFFDMRNKI